MIKFKIWRLARIWGVIPERRDGLWFFVDDCGVLASPERGLEDQEALEWLLS